MPLMHPHPDPVAFSLGPVAVHWYGLMYLLAFALFLALGRVRIRQPHIAALGWKKEDLDDMLFYGMLGVIVGGRLGEVLFYEPAMYLAHPLEIFMIWRGGMSFHGGFIGVMIGMLVWSRKRGKSLGDVYDFIAPLVPLGYACGRIGNFINAELPGRLADPGLPWAMIWPGVAGPRHPSPLYQALVDGVLVFLVLWPYAARQRPRWSVGAMFMLLYGCARFFTEYFRVPDWEVHAFGLPVTSGQVLSLPMIVVGAAVLVWAYRRERTLKDAL
jgi:phosphatidylglycerol:prolipoprotein diacylglycerol transferase